MKREQILKRCLGLAEHDESVEVSENTTLAELGYDSMDTLEYMANVEQVFDVDLPQDNYAVKTIGEIADVVWSVNREAFDYLTRERQ